MRGAPSGFDLIFSTDVLIYFGDLTALFAAAAQALEQGGILAVSTERGEDGWTLLPSARYAHGDDYVREVSAPWFDVIEQAEISLRRDATTTTPGGLHVMRRRA